MFVDTSEFEDDESPAYAETPMLPPPAKTNNHDPATANDRAFVADLITKRYNTPIDGSHIGLQEPRIMRQLAHDITSALLHDNPRRFTDQVRRTHTIIENTIVDLRRLQLNLKKARLIDQPETFWKRIADKITNPSYALPAMNLCLHLLTLIMSAMVLLCISSISVQ